MGKETKGEERRGKGRRKEEMGKGRRGEARKGKVRRGEKKGKWRREESRREERIWSRRGETRE